MQSLSVWANAGVNSGLAVAPIATFDTVFVGVVKHDHRFGQIGL